MSREKRDVMLVRIACVVIRCRAALVFHLVAFVLFTIFVFVFVVVVVVLF